MKTKTWEEIRTNKFTPDQLAEIDRWVADETMKINLRAVRELVGVTQVDAAERAGITQGELSRMERREDSRISTLRRYVEALGGELEVRAVFGNKTMRLNLGETPAADHELVVEAKHKRPRAPKSKARTSKAAKHGSARVPVR